MAYQYPYAPLSGAATPFNQQLQQMFPQPQGSVYPINSPLEIGNVPIGSTGLSVALCLNEGLMYIKSFQNNSPVIMTYRIAPHTTEQKSTQIVPDSSTQTSTTVIPDEITTKLKQLDTLQEKITKLEETISRSGGKFNELL